MTDIERQRLLDQQNLMLAYMRQRLDESVGRWHEEQGRTSEQQESNFEDQEDIEGFQVEPVPPKMKDRSR